MHSNTEVNHIQVRVVLQVSFSVAFVVHYEYYIEYGGKARTLYQFVKVGFFLSSKGIHRKIKKRGKLFPTERTGRGVRRGWW